MRWGRLDIRRCGHESLEDSLVMHDALAFGRLKKAHGRLSHSPKSHSLF